MTQQRIPLFLFSVLLAAAGCGGGPGTPIDVDPDAPPDIADQQPRISDQTPVITGALPGSPANSPEAPPGGGGGTCVDLCNSLPDRGCALPDEGCEAGCNPNSGERCASEALALAICALPITCPEDFGNLTQDQLLQIANLCPSQYAAVAACGQLD